VRLTEILGGREQAMANVNDFLRSIVENPHTADSTWLILADWLEEYHPDPRRADLLRLHRRLLSTCLEPDSHPQRGDWQTRLVELLTLGVRPCVPQQTIRISKKTTMTFSWIPPGSFLMGSPPQEEHRSVHEIQRKVTLTKGCYLGIHPVTQAQWRAIMGAYHPSWIEGWPTFEGDNLPVEVDPSSDCLDFCTNVEQKTGHRLRLPTEAEWEHACRAGTTTPFWSGETLTANQACHVGDYFLWLEDQSPAWKATTAVGTFPPNPWGLFDMHGNVWEWCQDYHDSNFYNGANTVDPVNRNENPYRRVIRGGSLASYSHQCRSANRYSDDAADHGHYIGLRVVLCQD
jgi:uncharacterized protein (TIGR02996 family)